MKTSNSFEDYGVALMMEEYISPDSSEVMSIIPIQLRIRVLNTSTVAPVATYNSTECISGNFTTETLLSSSL